MYIVALRVVVGIGGLDCTVAVVRGNFPFNSSDTFVVGCIVLPQIFTAAFVNIDVTVLNIELVKRNN